VDSIPKAVGLTVGAPIGASLILLWLLWARSRDAVRLAELATAALLPGVFLVFGTLGTGDAPFPPRRGSDWLLPLAGAGAVLGLLTALVPTPGATSLRILRSLLVWLARGALLAGFMALMARNALDAWGTGEALQRVGGWTLAGLAAWWGVERLARTPGPIPPLLLVVVCTGASIGIAPTGPVRLAILAAGVCACVGPAMLVAFRRPYFRLGAAASFVPAFLGGLWFITTTFNEAPIPAAALLALACVLGGVTTLGPLARLSGGTRWGVHLACVGIPTLGSIAWVVGTQPLPGMD
jgi:hypothetical protein